MEIKEGLLFFFSALGVFNGVFLSIYFLFFQKPRENKNIFLGALLLALSIRIGKSVFLYFIPDLFFGYLLFGLTACLFIGPFLFLYAKSSFNSRKKLYHKQHIIGAICFSVVLMSLYSLDKNNRRMVVTVIYMQWLFYILLSWYGVGRDVKQIISKPSKLSIQNVWQISIVLGVTLIWIAYNFAHYTSYISGALTFSFFLYLMILFLFFNKEKSKELFTPILKYRNKKIDQEIAGEQLEKLNMLMLDKKMYKNSNLKLSDLANELQLSSNQLSQLLNDNEGKSFSRYVNEFRIHEAKEMIVSDSKLTLESIGYECGFNSKSTFFTTFKKITGKTPSKYKLLI